MFNWKETGVSHPSLSDRGLTHPELEEGCEELELLWHEILMELTDKKFISRTHGNKRTAEAGCSGPLCRKGLREHGRRRRPSSQPRTYFLFLDPIIDYFRDEAIREIQLGQKQTLSRLSRFSKAV